MSDCSWAIPKVRAELQKLSPNGEDDFLLLLREGSLGVFWAAKRRGDPAPGYPLGGMLTR